MADSVEAPTLNHPAAQGGSDACPVDPLDAAELAVLVAGRAEEAFVLLSAMDAAPRSDWMDNRDCKSPSNGTPLLPDVNWTSSLTPLLNIEPAPLAMPLLWRSEAIMLSNCGWLAFDTLAVG